MSHHLEFELKNIQLASLFEYFRADRSSIADAIIFLLCGTYNDLDNWHPDCVESTLRGLKDNRGGKAIAVYSSNSYRKSEDRENRAVLGLLCKSNAKLLS